MRRHLNAQVAVFMTVVFFAVLTGTLAIINAIEGDWWFALAAAALTAYNIYKAFDLGADLPT